VGHTCHRDDVKSGAVPNVLRDRRSTVELLHGGIVWICNSEVVFSETELSQTRLYSVLLLPTETKGPPMNYYVKEGMRGATGHEFESPQHARAYFK
jgi:hypothetical protein